MEINKWGKAFFFIPNFTYTYIYLFIYLFWMCLGPYCVLWLCRGNKPLVRPPQLWVEAGQTSLGIACHLWSSDSYSRLLRYIEPHSVTMETLICQMYPGGLIRRLCINLVTKKRWSIFWKNNSSKMYVPKMSKSSQCQSGRVFGDLWPFIYCFLFKTWSEIMEPGYLQWL